MPDQTTPTPVIPYATAPGDRAGVIGGLRWLIALWAIASTAQVVSYWTMLAFNRWEIVFPFPFELQRPWVELAAAVAEASGFAAVLVAVARRGPLGAWQRRTLMIGGLVAGVGLFADRAVFMERPVQAFLDGYRQPNAHGAWYSPVYHALILGFRVAQSLPRLAMPALCVLVARSRDLAHTLP